MFRRNFASYNLKDLLLFPEPLPLRGNDSPEGAGLEAHGAEEAQPALHRVAATKYLNLLGRLQRTEAYQRSLDKLNSDDASQAKKYKKA